MVSKFMQRIAAFFCGSACIRCAPLPENPVDLTSEERFTYIKQIVQNPMWGEIIRELEYEAFGIWKNTPVSDSAGREFLYGHYRALDLIRKRVEGYLSHSALEEAMEAKRSKLPQP